MAESSRSPLRVFKNGNFSRLFSADATSIGGQSLGTVALTWIVFSSTGSATDVAYLALSSIVATALFSLFAGTFVDRHDRRRLMIVSDLVRSASLAVLAAELYFVGFSLPLILGVSFVLGTFASFFYPAERSLLPSLIRPEEVADANGLILTANSIFQAIASAAGGALVAIVGAVAAFGVNSATFGVSALLIASIVVAESSAKRAAAASPGSKSFLADMAAGVRYIAGWRGLLYLTLSAGIDNFFFTILTTFIVVYTAVVLHGGAEVYGLLLSMFALGFAPGALLVGRTRAVSRAGWVWIFSQVTAGAAVLLLAIAPDLAAAIGAMFFLGFVLGYGNSTWLSLVQLIVPSEMQGRYFGVDQLGSLGVIPVGQVLGAVLVESQGIRSAYLVAGVGVIATAMVFLLSKDLRSIRAGLTAGQAAPEGEKTINVEGA